MSHEHTTEGKRCLRDHLATQSFRMLRSGNMKEAPSCIEKPLQVLATAHGYHQLQAPPPRGWSQLGRGFCALGFCDPRSVPALQIASSSWAT